MGFTLNARYFGSGMEIRSGLRNNLLLTASSLSCALEVSLIFIGRLIPTQFRLYFYHHFGERSVFVELLSSWDICSSRYTLSTYCYIELARYSLNLTISGLGSLSQLIRLWSMPHYRFTLNEESYFADTELTEFNERNLFHVRRANHT